VAEKTLPPSQAQQDLAELLRTGLTSADLARMDFPPPNWVIPDILPEGLAVLFGKPKVGKSYLALNIATAVAAGTEILGQRVERHKVLYLALEDTPRRLKGRLDQLGAIPTDNLTIYTHWRKGSDGIENLRLWLTEYQDTRLVIVDTMSRIREPTRDDGNSYLADYAFMEPFKTLADGRNLTFLFVHHTRKAEAEDWMDAASGTTGITGAVDSTLFLDRGRGQVDANLSAAGRDFEEKELALQFSLPGGWVSMGDGADFRITTERRQILQLVKEATNDVSASELAATLGKKPNTMTYHLLALEKEGKVKKVRAGRYAFKESVA
jgi:DNA-binding transcriptional ArsR family regulator